MNSNQYTNFFIKNKTDMFYYVSRNLGITSSGYFTPDINKWKIFTSDEKENFEKNKTNPYGTTRVGIFVKIKDR